jgi:hypothetical protein
MKYKSSIRIIAVSTIAAMNDRSDLLRIWSITAIKGEITYIAASTGMVHRDPFTVFATGRSVNTPGSEYVIYRRRLFKYAEYQL